MNRASANYPYKVLALLAILVSLSFSARGVVSSSPDPLEGYLPSPDYKWQARKDAASYLLRAVVLNKMVAAPTIEISSNLGTFSAVVGQPPETYDYYYVSGSNFSPGQTVNIAINDPSGSFTISTTGQADDFGTSVQLMENGDGSLSQQLIFVKYEPTAAGNHKASIVHTSDGAVTQVLPLEGNATEATPLPVELMFFKAAITDQYLVLSWATATETNNSHFEIEMSQEVENGFWKVAKVASKNSNSSIVLNYTFRCTQATEAGTRYLRLKQVNLDGTFTYSHTIAVDYPDSYEQNVSIAPNPVTTQTRLCFTASEAGKVKVTIIDMSGSKVYQRDHKVSAGKNNIPLQLYQRLSPGAYLVMTEFNGILDRTKLIKK